MGTQTVAPANGKTIFKQSTLMDLNTFEEVTLRKEGVFVPVGTAQEALARVNGSTERLVEAINKGLEAFARQDLVNDDGDWKLVDDDGKMTDQTFSGIPADQLKVNNAVLTIAKSVFGYNKDMNPEQKRSAKEQAISLIKNTPVMFEGLKKNCALTGESAEATE